MDEAEVISKLQRLEETANHSERNALAIELADIRDPRLFEPLVRLIQRPELENNRGTLLYCLREGNYDCSSVTAMLRNLVRTGNFEVAAEAQMILDEQELG